MRAEGLGVSETFQHLDIDRDSRLRPDEIFVALRALGVCSEPADALPWLRAMGADGADGADGLSLAKFGEFVHMSAGAPSQQQQQELWAPAVRLSELGTMTHGIQRSALRKELGSLAEQARPSCEL